MKRKLGSTDGLKCGDCIFFKRKRPGQKVPCCQNGIKQFASAQVCFSPDVSQVTSNLQAFGALLTAFSEFNAQQKRILLAMLKNESKLKAKAFTFGTQVYFALNLGEYVSDYVSAFVLGYTPDGQVIISGVPRANSLGNSFIAFVNESSLISFADFEKIHSSLVAKGMVTNPDALNRLSLKKSYDIDSIPTIDTVVSDCKKKKREDVYDKIVKVFHA